MQTYYYIPIQIMIFEFLRVVKDDIFKYLVFNNIN